MVSNPLDRLNFYNSALSRHQLQVSEGKLTWDLPPQRGEGRISAAAIELIYQKLQENRDYLTDIHDENLYSMAYDIHLKSSANETRTKVEDIIIDHFIESKSDVLNQISTHCQIPLKSLGKDLLLNEDSPVWLQNEDFIKAFKYYKYRLHSYLDYKTVIALKSYNPIWYQLVSSNYLDGAGPLFTNDLLKMRDILEAFKKMGSNLESIFRDLKPLFEPRYKTLGSLEGTLTKYADSYALVSPDGEFYFCTRASSVDDFKGRVKKDFYGNVGHFFFTIITSVPNNQIYPMMVPVAALLSGAKTVKDLEMLKGAIDAIPPEKRLQVFNKALERIIETTPFAQRAAILFEENQELK